MSTPVIVDGQARESTAAVQRQWQRRASGVAAALGLSAGALTAALVAEECSAAVPMALSQSTIRLGLAFAVGGAPGALSVPATALADGVLKSMFLTQMKLTIAVLLALMVVWTWRQRQDRPIELLAVLSGMGFAMLGATIWGWFYVWSLAFFLLAIPIALCAPYGLTLLGVGWLVCLAISGIHLHWTR